MRRKEEEPLSCLNYSFRPSFFLARSQTHIGAQWGSKEEARWEVSFFVQNESQIENPKTASAIRTRNVKTYFSARFPLLRRRKRLLFYKETSIPPTPRCRQLSLLYLYRSMPRIHTTHPKHGREGHCHALPPSCVTFLLSLTRNMHMGSPGGIEEESKGGCGWICNYATYIICPTQLTSEIPQ